LINNQKHTGGKAERMDEGAKRRESKNLTTWKSQLMEKNMELKKDNAR
jgi:hypothetical protein